MNYSPLSVVKTEASQYYSNIHLSIYIPIIKSNNGSSQSRNKLRFCMSLKKIEKKLLDKGFSFAKIRELLNPLENKLESGIWKRNCSGVAIFYKKQAVKIFTHDHLLPQIEVVGESFYIEPLLNLSPEMYQKIIGSLFPEELQETGNLVSWQ